MSPASSNSGSGPSSPYTPASASFHPSAFTATFSSGSAPLDNVSYPSSTLESGLGLGLGDAAMAGMDPASYASYASAWAAASPWATSTAHGGAAGLAEGDFDIGRIPEIGWELGCAAFPASQPSFGGYDGVDGSCGYDGGEMGEYDEQGMDFGGEQGGEAPGELDLHFGDLGIDMGFDEMMAGQGF